MAGHSFFLGTSAYLYSLWHNHVAVLETHLPSFCEEYSTWQLIVSEDPQEKKQS